MAEYLLIPFVEFEIRFGTVSPNRFDSCIDKNHFEKIKSVLSTGTWVNVVETNTIEYSKDSTRLINDSSLILKENVTKNTVSLNNSPFDIRLSINQEFNLKSYLKSFDKKDSVIRNKTRKSFIQNEFKYDLTTVVQKANGITTTLYELEMEIFVTPETIFWKNDYLNLFIECKVYDIINIVEPIDRDKFTLSIINDKS
jgi:hypothetical protein